MKNNAPRSSDGRNRFWLAHAEAQTKSGLNRAEYCRQHNLSYHALTYWQRKRVTKVRHPCSTLVAVPATALRRASPQSTADMRVVLPNDITIELSNSFDACALKELLNVVERR